MIEFREASVLTTEGACILEPTSVTLGESHIAIIGANGSGKSTLVRLINGLAQPASGDVIVDGLSVSREARRVREIVGFLFTDPTAQLIMPTAIEDVALSLRRSIRKAGPRTEAALAQLEAIGLGDKGDVSVHALSGGQRQLLAIAGVLATNPRVVVADEPTTLLDLHWRRHVDTLLAALPQQIVEVTHDLDAALRADRVLVVDSGSVSFDGAPQAAVEHYRSLVTR